MDKLIKKLRMTACYVEARKLSKKKIFNIPYFFNGYDDDAVRTVVILMVEYNLQATGKEIMEAAHWICDTAKITNRTKYIWIEN